jgi:hypothetical protein
MKVLNLRCQNGHGFEGWFGSEEDFLTQNGSGMIECPMCSDRVVSRLPSAPRLNLSGAREPKQATASSTKPPAPSAMPLADAPPELQAAYMQAVKHVLENTVDVGPRFAEEARRIHYGETEQRGIRGQATEADRAALQDEGIEVSSFPLPAALKGSVQ